MKKTEHLYVGIDAHKKSWSVSIRTAELEHHTFHMKPEVEMLHNYLKKHFSGWRITCAYEASCVGYWIQKALTEKGYECLILNPADIPGTDKELLSAEKSVEVKVKLSAGIFFCLLFLSCVGAFLKISFSWVGNLLALLQPNKKYSTAEKRAANVPASV